MSLESFLVFFLLIKLWVESKQQTESIPTRKKKKKKAKNKTHTLCELVLLHYILLKEK